jgi:ribonuclease VapC
MSSGAVLDASAVLAHLFAERGGEKVLAQLNGSMISAVNWAEVVERAIVYGMESESLRSQFEQTGARVVAVEAEHAEYAARLHRATRPAGLSLADRICFALAASRGSAVMTADRAWATIDLGVEVRLIR